MNYRVDMLAIVALGVITLLALLPTAAYATNLQPCQINSWSPSYPSQVNPDQTIQVTSTINVACAQWRTYYTARVDLVNRATDQWYSTSEFQIGWQSEVNATITNTATAPQTSGEWKLQYNLYIFEEGSQDGNPFHNSFNINVDGSNTSSSTTQQNATAAAPAAAQQQLVSNATAAVPQAQPALNTNPPSSLSDDAPYITILLASICLIGCALIATRENK